MFHQFNIDHAIRFGDREAIAIHYFVLWIGHNKANGKNQHEGRFWTYNSMEALSKIFPYWTKKQVRGVIESLIKQKVLVTGTFNKVGFDRTTWYAFEDEAAFLKDFSHLPKTANAFAQNGEAFAPQGEPIPSTNTSFKLPCKRVNRQKPGNDYLQPRLIDFFDKFYEATFSEKFVWLKKDAVAVSKIAKSLAQKRAERGLGASDDEILESFEVFTERAYVCADKFIKEHFTPSTLFSHINTVINAIKNGKQVINRDEFAGAVEEIQRNRGKR